MRWVSAAWFAAAILVTAAGAGAYFQFSSPAPEMTEAARAWLDTLDDNQRAMALMPYDAAQRVDWHFIPKDERKGVQVKHMNEQQRKAAMRLMRSALSQIGYSKARTIMALEELLKELESGKSGTPLRDSERYYFTVFGEPKADTQWGLSIEGHHLSLNFVVKQNAIASTTPTVYCANPAVVMNENSTSIEKGTRLLENEELLAFELLRTLSDEQRKVAVIASEAPREIRGAGEPQPPQAPPEGLSVENMERQQLNLLRRLVEVYADNMPAEVAQQRMQAIAAAGPEKVHFAWAGADRPGVGHYYRIQGPTFLIEFVNTQPDAAGNPANHIHSIWRDMSGDFAIPVAN